MNGAFGFNFHGGDDNFHDDNNDLMRMMMMLARDDDDVHGRPPPPPRRDQAAPPNRGDEGGMAPVPRPARPIDDNNDDDVDDGGGVDEDLPIAVALPRRLHHRGEDDDDEDVDRRTMNHRYRRLRHRLARAAIVEDGDANVLYTLVREGVHCKDDLVVSPGGCPTVVERCRDHPHEVHFIDRQTGRTPLHEAALRCSCIHVVRALLQAGHDTFRFDNLVDNLVNTPLHLLFAGIASRQIDPARIHLVVEELLSAGSPMIVNATNLEGYTPLHV